MAGKPSKIAENWIIVCIVTAFIGWGVRDMMNFRTNNFENMVDKFVTDKRFTEFKNDINNKFDKIDNKMDAILDKFVEMNK